MDLKTLRTLLNSCDTLVQVQSVFGAFQIEYGADFFTCFTIGERTEDGMCMKPIYPYGDMHHPWPLHYASNNHFYKDTALLSALDQKTGDLPVRWSEVPRKHPYSVVYSEATDAFGLREGVVFPITNANGSVSIFTIAGETFDPSDEDLAVLNIGARALHLVAMSFMKDPIHIAPPELTPRQIEVLRLMAKGLSNSVIASELGTKTDNVKLHVSNICKSLGAVNRGHAVFKGLRNSLMTLYPGG